MEQRGKIYEVQNKRKPDESIVVMHVSTAKPIVFSVYLRIW